MTALRLPESLQPWRRWLEWFAPEIALGLGDVLKKLAPALGAFRSAARGAEPEPVGVDDLARRGDYRRLLLSEWALAEEMPDEFVRRAASGEHLFLAPRPRTRQADERCVALFDAGADQLGAPRLVQVALLILLARRAERAGVRFEWGVVHDGNQRLHDADDVAKLKLLLRARSWARTTAAHVDAWRERLAKDPRPGECWLIGGAALAASGFGHRVAIARGFDGALDVAIAAPSARRTVRLEVDADRLDPRLLRGAFSGEAFARASRRSEAAFALGPEPLIAPEGRYVAQPILAESAALIFRIPQRENEKPREPKKAQWPYGPDVLCGALSASTLGAVLLSQKGVAFWQLDGFNGGPRPEPGQLRYTPGRKHWSRCAWLNGGGLPHRLVMLDDAGNLVCWSASSQAPREPSLLEHIAGGVVALERAGNEHAVFARFVAAALHIFRLPRAGPATQLQTITESRVGEVFFCGLNPRNKWRGAVSVADDRGAGNRRVYWYGGDNEWRSWVKREIAVGQGWRVAGLIRVPTSRELPFGLVAIAPDKRRLVLLALEGMQTLFTSGSDIRNVAIAQDCDLIALVNERRELIVLTESGTRLALQVSGPEGGDE